MATVVSGVIGGKGSAERPGEVVRRRIAGLMGLVDAIATRWPEHIREAALGIAEPAEDDLFIFTAFELLVPVVAGLPRLDAPNGCCWRWRR